MAPMVGNAGLARTWRRAMAGIGILTAGGLGAAFVLLPSSEEPVRAQVQAASVDNTEAGPARCPDAWDANSSPSGGKADLVPTGATEAFLCTYRYDSDTPLRLDASRKATQRVDDLSAYLNGLPTDQPQDEMCLLGQTVEHAIVFGYPQQRAVSVRLVDCGWKREGASRYGGDLRKVTAYWGVSWNE
ncbi:hypothetical protein [Micromonospora humida]|uniref:Serine/threonine protein kinase n=1 Tax=Micromonospora humida TaxID=2809018 RepID=A0ABS2IVH5_9ACTN|nr:hypothetical protein [Micromonospora humida]MBM7078337.1 hypothetical protein [Micromonospora humida]